MWKKLVVFLMFIALVHCDKFHGIGIKKKPHHHHHHNELYYGAGLLYYLTFLAIKVKIAVIIGGVITMLLVFGKLWALITYTKYMMGDSKHKEPEKIYIHEPMHDHGDMHHGPPFGFDNQAFLDHPPTYQSKHTSHGIPPYLENPPPSFDSAPNGYPDGSQGYPGASQGYPGQGYPGASQGFPIVTPNSYQRSFSGSLLNDLNKVVKIMEKMDLTEMTFKSMNLTDEECKRKFVCEVNIKSRKNYLLALGFSMFSNKGLEKYKTEDPVSNIEDCQELYPKCSLTKTE